MNAPFDGNDDDVVGARAPGALIRSEAEAEAALDSVMWMRDKVARHKASVVAVEGHLKSLEAWWLPQLEEYYRAHPPRSGKTVRLTNGDLASRKVPGGIRVDDEAACLEWCETHWPEAIARSIVRKLDVERAKREAERLYGAELAKAFTSAEDVVDADEAFRRAQLAARLALPPGCSVHADTEKFEVKPPPKKGA